MHGRPRKSSTATKSAEEEKASALKASKLRSLQSQFFHFHHNHIYTKEALEINAKLIEANPEFMTAWNFRKLAFQHNITQSDEAPAPDRIKSIIDQELQVVESALRKNFKSYGAWHHRKWVVSKGNTSTERELGLLNLFQKQDSRNFHAWNYRRFIANLKNIPDEKELQYTTDMINDNFSNYSAWHNRSKIGKLTLARLLMAYDDMVSTETPNMSQVEEVLQLYSELMKLDPPHHQYYKDEHSLVFLKQVTSSKDSLLKYCWQYKESSSTNITGSMCLRLNSLLLSQIGSFERLLWVQSLDLSHNQLHSIEGLEALQLLSCLNLSHNKLGSFTALNPLRLLKSLKVLDISHNEIGAHTVDTRRYLCSSPLSHTLAYDNKFEEFANGDAKVVNFWEAYSIFGGLNLIQLNIVGNAAADERFVSFLVKLLPGLKWLDDVELK